MGSPLCFLDHAGLEPKAQVLIEGREQVGPALRLLQEAERSHLRTIVGAGADFAGASQAELRISGLAKNVCRELRCDPGLNRGLGGRPLDARDGEVGLAMITLRGLRSGRDV